MDLNKSLDQYKLIAALLSDVHSSHGTVFNCRALRLTLRKVKRRANCEGMRFFTVALPRLGKALDRALTCECLKNVRESGFKTRPNSELPMFMGEFFERVFASDGTILHDPCVDSVRVIRQICLYNYKYEIPYTDRQSQQVIAQFEKTEQDCGPINERCSEIANIVDSSDFYHRRRRKAVTPEEVTREARILLSSLLASFDGTNIVPRHGPGAVATRQSLWDKYRFTNIASKITDVYPLDAYFCASSGHVCDSCSSAVPSDGTCRGIQADGSRTVSSRQYGLFANACTESLPARVILVPKDSRGPRLISCEPVDFQWVQQGLSRALVRHVENAELTKHNVFFTDQRPNQLGALLGSQSGKYATIDLKEASDRVTTGLVSLLFPSHVYTYLDACRSLSTVLPDGRVLKLQKYAPMGSALCFPVMALCIWAILTAAAPDTDTRESILVYGDDVIVPTAYAVNAIEQLESFGLLANRDKSCTSGLFRESCGTDAFKGVEVTPVRFRTVWSSEPRPDVYESWIAYANSLFDKRYYHAYDYIVGCLHHVYGKIPDDSISLKRYPSLRVVSDEMRPTRSRVVGRLQTRQYYVRICKSPSLLKSIDGWSMLLRYFSNTEQKTPDDMERAERRSRASWVIMAAKAHVPKEAQASNRWYDGSEDGPLYSDTPPFSVRLYTRPQTSLLVWRWR